MDARVFAIAHGAVLRAMNKSKGPARKILSSYGFLQTLPKDIESYPTLKRVKATRDPVDGFDYVKNTINWLIKKVHIHLGRIKLVLMRVAGRRTSTIPRI